MSAATLTGRRLCLTGATGTIGSRVLAAALHEEGSVVALVRSSSMERLSGAGAEVVAWDLDAPALPEEALRGVDTVCHMAAFIPPDMHDSAHAEACLRRNAVATLRLLESARRAGVRRFVYFSSGNTYLPQGRPAREEDPLFPASRAPYYLASKMVGEVFVEHVGAGGEMSTVTLRVSSVYGPGMRPHGLVPRFLDAAANGERLVVRDGGRYAADLVYVDDVVDATLWIAGDAGITGPLNVGSGVASTTLDVARAVAALHSLPEERVEVLAPTGAPVAAEGFAPLDISRAVRVLGYAPVPLREGLARTVARRG